MPTARPALPDVCRMHRYLVHPHIRPTGPCCPVGDASDALAPRCVMHACREAMTVYQLLDRQLLDCDASVGVDATTAVLVRAVAPSPSRTWAAGTHTLERHLRGAFLPLGLDCTWPCAT